MFKNFFVSFFAAFALMGLTVLPDSFSDAPLMGMFSPIITKNDIGAQKYRADFFGGYSFIIKSKWENISNFNLKDAVNIIAFTLDSDNTQSLSLSVTMIPPEERGKPFDLKTRVANSLNRKGIQHGPIKWRLVEIEGRTAELSEVALAGKRAMCMVGMERENLSLVATLGYIPEQKKTSPEDLIDMLSSFSTSQN